MFKHNKTAIVIILSIDLVAIVTSLFTGIFININTARNILLVCSSITLVPIIIVIFTYWRFRSKVIRQKEIVPNEIENKILYENYGAPKKVSHNLLLSIKIRQSLKNALLGIINSILLIIVYIILMFS